MRTKEEAKDYRYFPEPDLPPFIISKDKIAQTRETIPELPKKKKLRFMKEYGLTEYDAGILVLDKADADYAEECLRDERIKNKKLVANWLIGPMAAIASSNNIQISKAGIPAHHVTGLVDLVENKQVISNLTGKTVLVEMFSSKKEPALIIQEKNLAQISDSGALEAKADEVIGENPKSVQDFHSGKSNAIMFLVGQVMKKTGGKANPKVVQEILKKKLNQA
jgi:aspartyl-tRNA(Asn)/glutamyl-tRNA(Gln) amidotransferase subunit B